MRNMLIFVVSVLFACCQSQKEFNNRSLPPAWAKDVIWYQIFVERFNNGDPTNDPTIAAISTPTASFPVPEDWQITPWGWDWYEQESWAKATGLPLRETMQHRRYGGDLQGIFDKLDYLSELGITAIYFNPLNDAPSLHKYDARNYHHIDVNFGPDPHGDIQIIASEDPSDPATWQWTSADKLFLKLVDELHKRNIRVIVDYSWNHTGALFWAWQDILKNQEASPYKDWYEIITFDDPATPENEFDYKGWLNIKSLPEFKKVDVVGGHAFAHPFEGNLPEDVKTHVFAVTCRWLAPDGDVSKGIDGFRLDVAEQVPMGFWRDYRRFVKGTNPDALLVGEIWWEQWPDKLMNPVPYTRGDIFDAVMFYHVYRPARGFFALGEPTADAGQLAKGLEFEWSRLQKPFRYAMMNVNGTHDSPRLLTCFANRGKYKYHANPYEDSVYLSGKPDPETFQRVRLYLVHQFTSIGAPHIWNGDEMGMWGADDPDCRKPLWWKELTFSSEISTNMLPSAKKYENVAFDAEHFEFYKKMIKLRKAQPVLINGDIEFMLSEGKCLMYKRTNNDETLFVLLNLEANEVSFDVPGKQGFIDLLKDELIDGNTVSLEPLSAKVLKPR